MRNSRRSAKDSVRPVQQIELSDKNIKPRVLFAVLFLIFGMVCIGIGLMSALETETDWQEIEATATVPNCSEDFVLMYDFSDAGKNASSMSKALANLYSEAVVTGYRCFSAYHLEDGLGNVAYLNAHINEIVTVEGPLYRALEQVVASGDRHVYLAPAMERYRLVFSSESDEEAALYDPATSSETAQWLEELAKYVVDPEMIEIVLYDQCQVQLKVSEEYLAFVKENEIDILLDFDWMINAFIADYLAQVLMDNGYTSGYLSSYDGFTRNLDTRNNTYYVSLLSNDDGAVAIPAVTSYEGANSLVLFRNFAVSDSDDWQYYTYSTGETVTSYLDVETCMSKASTDSLLSYSTELSCGEILLQTLSLYASDTLDVQKLNALTSEGIYSVWCDGKSIYYNDSDLTLATQLDTYTVNLVK